MKPTDNSRLINRLIANKLIQNLFSYLFYLHQISQFYQLLCSDLCQLKHDCLWFFVLSPTVQSKLSRQPHCQSPYLSSVFCFILSYLIQSTSLFDQTFLSISDHLLGSNGNHEGLLEHLVGPRLSRSSALHRVSQIFHYTI